MPGEAAPLSYSISAPDTSVDSPHREVYSSLSLSLIHSEFGSPSLFVCTHPNTRLQRDMGRGAAPPGEPERAAAPAHRC